MGRKRNDTAKSAAHRRLKRWLFCLAALILIPVAAVAAYVLSRDAWHMLDEEKLSCGQLSVQVFDGDDQLFSALSGGEERLLTQVADLPEHVKNAFIAAEDARFYDHPGVDAVRILGAAWSDLKAGAFVEGASTITQQLIKLTHLNSRKELSRRPFWRCSWSAATARIRSSKCTSTRSTSAPATTGSRPPPGGISACPHRS